MNSELMTFVGNVLASDFLFHFQTRNLQVEQEALVRLDHSYSSRGSGFTLLFEENRFSSERRRINKRKMNIHIDPKGMRVKWS